MKNDEDQIRELVDGWMAASRASDVETVLSLMTDDVVFLTPGRPPMRKEDFVAAAKAQSSRSAPKFDGSSEIQEIQVLGDWAFMWSRLKVIATSPDGSPPMVREGHTLTISQEREGQVAVGS